jgi:hypothetical protein
MTVEAAAESFVQVIHKLLTFGMPRNLRPALADY